LVLKDTEASSWSKHAGGCEDFPGVPPWNHMCGGILGPPGRFEKRRGAYKLNDQEPGFKKQRATYSIIAWALSGRSYNPLSEAAHFRKAICVAAERRFAVILARLLVALKRDMDRKSAMGI